MRPLWMTADKKSLQGLTEMLNEYTLDPICLNYGKYCYISKREHYHFLHTPKNDKYVINASFLEASWHYDGNDEDNKKLYLSAKKLINQHLKTDKFQKAIKEQFNAVTLELTIFLTPEKLKDLGYINQMSTWWIDIKSNKLFNINNWFNDEFKKEWKRLDNEAQSLKNVLTYHIRPKFKEIHYTNEEYDELLKLIGDFNNKRSTCLNQARRFTLTNPPTRLQYYKDYTLKCTGRKLKFDPESYYSFMWFEIDPVIK